MSTTVCCPLPSQRCRFLDDDPMHGSPFLFCLMRTQSTNEVRIDENPPQTFQHKTYVKRGFNLNPYLHQGTATAEATIFRVDETSPNLETAGLVLVFRQICCFFCEGACEVLCERQKERWMEKNRSAHPLVPVDGSAHHYFLLSLEE